MAGMMDDLRNTAESEHKHCAKYMKMCKCYVCPPLCHARCRYQDDAAPLREETSTEFVYSFDATGSCLSLTTPYRGHC